MNKNVEFLNNRIQALEKRMAANAISDEARAEIEATISGLREAASALENVRDTAAEGTDDNSEAMRSQMNEILARIGSLETEVADAVANAKKPVKANATLEFANKFIETVRNSFTRAEFIENRKALVKNAFDGYADISTWLPAAVLQEVTDTFSNRHRLLKLVTWTGLPAWLSQVETGGDGANVYDETSADGLKTKQDVDFTSIEIRPKYIYKYFACAREIERETRDNGDKFVSFIVRELLDRVLLKVEQSILLGNSTQFIAPTGTAAVLDASNNVMYHAMNYLPYVDSNDLIAIVSPALYASIMNTVQSTYGYMVTDEFIARRIFGVSEVVFMPQGVVGNLPADSIGLMFMDARNYVLVGDRRPDEFEDFNLAYNKKEYLTEMWIGGGETRYTTDASDAATQSFINITNA